MTGAAKSLGITQGAVSQQIIRLEKSLNLQLISRDKRELRLLPAGIQLRHHALKVMEDIRDCERSMQRFSGYSYPTLSVGVMDTLGKTLAGPLLDTLQNVAEQIRLRASVTYRHREDMQSGALDLLISAQHFEPGAFEIYPIATEPILLLAPKNFVPAGEVLDLDKLSASLPLVRFAHQRRLGRMSEEYLARHVVTIRRSIEIDQATPVLDSVKRGQGWAISTPFNLLDPTFDHENIDVIALPGPVPTREINLICKPHRFGDLPLRLAENCRAYLSQRVAQNLSAIVPQAALPTIPSH